MSNSNISNKEQTLEIFKNLIHEENINNLEVPQYYCDYLKKTRYLNNLDTVNDRIELIESIIDKYDLRNKKILEIGSHFGFEIFIFSSLGVNNVFGVDYRKTSNNIAIQLKEKFFIKNNVHFYQGDVQNLQFENETFDFIYCRSVVSHISNYRRAYQEIYRALKPGGILYISDENNFLKSRKFRRDTWKKADFGPEKVSKTVSVDVPYIEIRKKIIKNLYPCLGNTKVNEMAKMTYGYAKDELINVVKRYVESGRRIPKTKLVARDPETGWWAEREINPFKEMNIIKKIGFRKRVLVYFVKKKHRKIYKEVILNFMKRFPFLFLFLNDRFNIEATK